MCLPVLMEFGTRDRCVYLSGCSYVPRTGMFIGVLITKERYIYLCIPVYERCSVPMCVPDTCNLDHNEYCGNQISVQPTSTVRYR